MIDLYSPAKLGSLNVKNHFIRAACWEKTAENGAPAQAVYDHYEDLCKGGIGAILTGFTTVDPVEHPAANMLGMHDDSLVDTYRPLIEMVHSYDVRIVCQIVYGGACGPANKGNDHVFAPSAIQHPGTGIMPVEMTEEDMNFLANEFAAAARRCKDAGFDGVELHAAHGYLLSQFLSPDKNIRTDAYGGSIENRTRFLCMVAGRVRAVVGEDFPIWCKINSSDATENGLTEADSLVASQLLLKNGVDVIEVSGGNLMQDASTPETQSYFRNYAAELRKLTGAPVILTGGNRSLSVMQQIAEESDVQFFGFGRPICQDPSYVMTLKENA